MKRQSKDTTINGICTYRLVDVNNKFVTTLDHLVEQGYSDHPNDLVRQYFQLLTIIAGMLSNIIDECMKHEVLLTSNPLIGVLALPKITHCTIYNLFNRMIESFRLQHIVNMDDDMVHTPELEAFMTTVDILSGSEFSKLYTLVRGCDDVFGGLSCPIKPSMN